MKTLKLILIIGTAWWLFNKTQGESINVPAGGGTSDVQINADSIKRICEMAGASQIVEVRFDTTWVSKTQNFKLFGLGIDALEKDVVNRYTEVRVWKVRAVVKTVDIERVNGRQVVVLSYPVIDGSSEEEGKFRVLHQTGANWNPVSTHQHMHRTRRLAEAKAARAGIQEEAAASVMEKLRSILPNQIQIRYDSAN